MAESIHILPQTTDVAFIWKNEFDRVRQAHIPLLDKLQLLADMNRFNTLSTVKKAGSGHLGSSLSAMDIVTWLYFHQMNVVEVGIDNPHRDIYFSSKGHDVPGLYSTLYAVGILPKEKLLKLRRFGGLDGHPDIKIPGIEANTGSLGMGISKGKGMALAKRMQGFGGHVYVLTGDGEWQEGQNYEGLHSAAQHHVGNLTVIIDNNKLQSDKLVTEIMKLGEIEAQYRSFGWHVARCNGHDYAALQDVFATFAAIEDQPKLLIADTIKGRGVSFMEHPFALANNNGLYPWHAGAPDDEAYTAARNEVMLRLMERCDQFGVDQLQIEQLPPDEKLAGGVTKEYVAAAYGKALVDLAPKHKNLVVLDADLAADCHVRNFENTYPQRFIEIGIAEQDMVSTAAGLASQGMLPVVNSFASFLASRANEQIYNAATEGHKIIYVCHFAGLIPAGPGKSHQSLRDISLFGALPNITILQPGTPDEARMVTEYAVEKAPQSCMIRLNIGPCPRHIDLPAGYSLPEGQGFTLHKGTDALLFTYGAVMLHEALTAAELLAPQGFGLQIVNMPWLNRIDEGWLRATVTPHHTLFILEDHAPVGGLGDFLLNVLVRMGLIEGRIFTNIAVEGFPACGTPQQALAHHRMDGASLAERIRGNGK